MIIAAIVIVVIIDVILPDHHHSIDVIISSVRTAVQKCAFTCTIKPAIMTTPRTPCECHAAAIPIVNLRYFVYII